MSTRAFVYGVSIVLSFAACQTVKAPVASRFEGEAMGTTYLVQVADPLTESERIAVSRTVDETLDDIDLKMSTYRADSEVSRFNRAAAGVSFPLSPDTYAVFVEALEVSELTEGAFDITVAPLVRLWGFGAEAGEPLMPTAEDVARVRERVGYLHLRLSDDPPSVSKTIDELEIDLSGIAKGYAVDQVAELLLERGAINFMVELGGEVRTSGKNSSGEAWRIGIERPVPGERQLYTAIPLSGLSLATSGDYRNFYEADGKLYSHLIDPRAGSPVSHPLASVSVVGLTCMRADALASGLLVLGPEAGFELAVREDLAVLFLIRTEAGEIEERATPSYAALFRGVSTMEP